MKQHKAELWAKWRELVSEQSQSGHAMLQGAMSREAGVTFENLGIRELSDAYRVRDISDIDVLFITHDRWDRLDHDT